MLLIANGGWGRQGRHGEQDDGVEDVGKFSVLIPIMAKHIHINVM
jgi:hypothetical protein